MRKKSSVLMFNFVLFVATLATISGCGQFNKEGKLNPGGCDGPNSYSIDAAPSADDVAR